MKKLINIFPVAVLMLLFNSCKTNKVLDLSSEEAFTFAEKAITFSVGCKSYFYFDLHPVFQYPGLQDAISFESAEKPEYVILKKTKIKFSELEFEKIMNNSMAISLRSDNKYWGYPTLKDSEKINVFDLQREYDEKYKTGLSLEQLYEKFKNTNSMEVIYYVEYKIGDKTVTSQLACRYKVFASKSLRFIDTIMSI